MNEKSILKILITLVDDDNEYDKEIMLNFKKFDSFSEFCNVIYKCLDLRPSNKFSIKIFYENSWMNLIDLKSFYFFVSNSLIYDQTPHLKLEKLISEEESKYDLKGGKINSEYCKAESSRPNMKVYESWINPEVLCVFCGFSSKDENKLQRLGPFYGPAYHGARKYYFHEMCVIWTPLVCLDEYGKLQHVEEEISRAKKNECSYCGKKGAGLGCIYKTCHRNYHILCAKSDGSLLNNKDYEILCKDHKNIQFDDKKHKKEDFIEPQVDEICYECKSLLFDKDDDDCLIFCDNCNLAIHRYCNKPAVIDLPPENEEFYCYTCVDSIKNKIHN